MMGGPLTMPLPGHILFKKPGLGRVKTGQKSTLLSFTAHTFGMDFRHDEYAVSDSYCDHLINRGINQNGTL